MHFSIVSTGIFSEKCTCISFKVVELTCHLCGGTDVIRFQEASLRVCVYAHSLKPDWLVADWVWPQTKTLQAFQIRARLAVELVRRWKWLAWHICSHLSVVIINKCVPRQPSWPAASPSPTDSDQRRWRLPSSFSLLLLILRVHAFLYFGKTK